MENVNKGNAFYVDEDYQQALHHYTLALKELGGNANVYAARAQAHLRLENYMDAAEDAGKAIDLDTKLAKAYLRKGIACFYLEEYESARKFFLLGSEIEPGRDLGFKTWARKCDAEIEDEMDDDGNEEIGDKPSNHPAKAAVPAGDQSLEASKDVQPETSTGKEKESADIKPISPAAPNQAPGKYRHQWYETTTHTIVSVFAKKMTNERVNVSIEEDNFTVETKSEAGEIDYELHVQLKGRVAQDDSSFEILGTKIEIKLKKLYPGTWGSLSRTDNDSAEISNPDRPAYPSSYKKKVVDWNKLEQEVKTEEEGENLEGDAAVQKLFQKIYAGADEDTRRAMNKSFQESNGTVLSTNWTEVGSKKVECTPPSGMEPKQY